MLQGINTKREIGIKNVKASKFKQTANQENKHDSNQQPSTNQPLKSLDSMTFSQNFFQAQEIEIAEEYEQAIEANSLEKIEQLLDKVIEMGR